MVALGREVNRKRPTADPTPKPDETVILFVKLPRTGHQRLFARLQEALGADAVGWLGRNVPARQIRHGLPSRSFALLGGAVSLGSLRSLDGVSLIATLLPATAEAIPLAEWSAARQNPKHPHHAIAHTLTFTEVLDEEHPFARQLTNAATRQLTPRGAAETAKAVLDAVDCMPFLAGLSSHREAFGAELAAALRLPAGRLAPDLFRSPPPPTVDRATLEAARRASVEDRLLIEAVAERIGTSGGVFRSKALAGAR